MERLRDPERGCPWDREQTFATIAPYTIEEAYEVAEAIRSEDWKALADELGDLLFQVIFHARMAEEAGHFDFATVVEAICEKMERRHPHVFGTTSIADAETQSHAWEEHKARERGRDVFGGVALALPALKRAQKLQARVAHVGFDWAGPEPARAKILEELGELDAARRSGADPAKLEDELGDILFAAVNLARHLKIDAETALSRTNFKFMSRFAAVERGLKAEGRSFADTTLDEMERHWIAAKKAERGES
jgi:MazG family protein